MPDSGSNQREAPPIARPVDEAALGRFLACCNKREVAKKHLIMRKGDPADTLFYLISGTAIVVMEDEDDPGSDIILAYINGGEFIGEIGLFYTTYSRQTFVRAKTRCELAEIRYDTLQKLFEDELKEDHAQILMAVGRQLSQRLMQTSRKVGQLAFMDVSGRVARTLLDLSKESTAMSHPDGRQIKISRSEIARIVGCSREMVGRVLKTLAEQKLISVQGMTIVIHESL